MQPATPVDHAPTWTHAGRAEWLDDGVRLRCRAGPRRARVEYFELLFGTVVSVALPVIILTKTWTISPSEGFGTVSRVAVSAVALPFLLLAVAGARLIYRHHREGPPEDVFDRATRTFRSGMDRPRSLPFDEISHLALRDANGILYAIEVHSRRKAKPIISRVHLTQPAADTLAARAAQVVGVPFDRKTGG